MAEQFDPHQYATKIDEAPFDPYQYGEKAEQAIPEDNKKAFMQNLLYSIGKPIQEITGPFSKALMDNSDLQQFEGQDLQAPQQKPGISSIAGISALAGQLGGLGTLGEATGVPRAGAAAAGLVERFLSHPGIARAVSERAAGILSRGVGRAVSGAGYSEEAGGSPGSGALLNAAIPEQLPGLSKYLAKKFAPKMTAAEFGALRSQTPQGIKPNIGDLTGSPVARNIQSGLSLVPFSGIEKPYTAANTVMEGLKDQLIGRPSINDIPRATNDVTQELVDNLQNAKRGTKDAYDRRNNLADLYNVNINKSGLNKRLKTILDNRKVKSDLPGAKALYGPTIDELKNVIKYPHKNFNQLAAQEEVINGLLHNSKKPGSEYNTSLLRESRDALRKHTDEELKKQKFPDLQEAISSARAARTEQGKLTHLPSKKSSPFYSLYSKGASDYGSLIPQYVRPSKKGDMSGLLKNLTGQLSPEGKENVATATFADTAHSLPKFLTKLKSFNDLQHHQLFGDKKRLVDELLKYDRIYPEGKSPGYLPKTGALGEKVRAAMAAASLPAGVATGLMSLPAAAGLAATPLAARGVSRFLQSEKLKNLIQKGLEEKAGTRAVTRGSKIRKRFPAAIGSALQPDKKKDKK